MALSLLPVAGVFNRLDPGGSVVPLEGEERNEVLDVQGGPLVRGNLLLLFDILDLQPLHLAEVIKAEGLVELVTGVLLVFLQDRPQAGSPEEAQASGTAVHEEAAREIEKGPLGGEKELLVGAVSLAVVKGEGETGSLGALLGLHLMEDGVKEVGSLTGNGEGGDLPSLGDKLEGFVVRTLMAQEGEADEGCAAVGEFGPVVLRLFDPSPDTVLSDSGGGEGGRLVDGGGLSGCGGGADNDGFCCRRLLRWRNIFLQDQLLVGDKKNDRQDDGQGEAFLHGFHLESSLPPAGGTGSNPPGWRG